MLCSKGRVWTRSVSAWLEVKTKGYAALQQCASVTDWRIDFWLIEFYLICVLTQIHPKKKEFAALPNKFFWQNNPRPQSFRLVGVKKKEKKLFHISIKPTEWLIHPIKNNNIQCKTRLLVHTQHWGHLLIFIIAWGARTALFTHVFPSLYLFVLTLDNSLKLKLTWTLLSVTLENHHLGTDLFC